jgi:hypothetical protein
VVEYHVCRHIISWKWLARVSDLGAAAPVAQVAKAVPIGAFSSPWAANLKFGNVLD